MCRMGLVRKSKFELLTLFEQFVIDKNCLNEGFIKSYNAGAVIKSLIKQFNLSTDENQWKDGNAEGFISMDNARQRPKNLLQRIGKELCEPVNDEIVVITIYSYNNDFPKLKEFMTACGWFFSYEDWNDEVYEISFEKHFQESVNDFYNGDTLYHLTPKSRVRKIMTIGLTPKTCSKKSYHPERIYLFTKELSQDELYNWIFQFSECENEKTIKQGYVVLKIDRSKCPNIKIFADPNLDGGVFTVDNIPPTAITIEKEVI